MSEIQFGGNKDCKLCVLTFKSSTTTSGRLCCACITLVCVLHEYALGILGWRMQARKVKETIELALMQFSHHRGRRRRRRRLD